MKIDRKYFCFYETFYNQLKALPEEKQISFFFSMCEYAFYNIEPTFDGLELALWVGIRDAIEGQRSRSEKRKEQNKEYYENLKNLKNFKNTEKSLRKLRVEEEEVEKEKEYEYEYEKEYEYEYENEKENEEEKENLKKQKNKKNKYGEFKNVLLTPEEKEKLIEKLQGEENFNNCINFFSQMKEMKGYKYKSDYLALLKWGINTFIEESKKKYNFSDLKIAEKKTCALCGGELDNNNICQSCFFPNNYKEDQNLLFALSEIKKRASNNFSKINQYIFSQSEGVTERLDVVINKLNEGVKNG